MILGRPQIRECINCKIVKEDSDFYTQKTKATKSGYSTARTCKECTKVRAKLYRQNNKKDIVDRALARRMAQKQKAVDAFGNKCFDCQQTFPICCYDFHHLNPDEKEYSVGNAFNGYRAIQEELDKCIMLCSNCHRLRHYIERRNVP